MSYPKVTASIEEGCILILAEYDDATAAPLYLEPENLKDLIDQLVDLECELRPVEDRPATLHDVMRKAEAGALEGEGIA